MASFFQLVAPVLVGAILGGTQCIEFCSFLSLERQAEATLATTTPHDLPCHQHHSPKDSPPPANGEQCAHQELLAVEGFDASYADHFQTVSIVAVRIEAPMVPVPSSSPLTLVHEQFPGTSPVALTSILRI